MNTGFIKGNGSDVYFSMNAFITCYNAFINNAHVLLLIIYEMSLLFIAMATMHLYISENRFIKYYWLLFFSTKKKKRSCKNIF